MNKKIKKALKNFIMGRKNEVRFYFQNFNQYSISLVDSTVYYQVRGSLASNYTIDDIHRIIEDIRIDSQHVFCITQYI